MQKGAIFSISIIRFSNVSEAYLIGAHVEHRVVLAHKHIAEDPANNNGQSDKQSDGEEKRRGENIYHGISNKVDLQ